VNSSRQNGFLPYTKQKVKSLLSQVLMKIYKYAS